jgi:hypothetical protein
MKRLWKVARRAIQLGLHGDVLHAFATTEILDVFVAEQRAFSARDRWHQLQTPEELVYWPFKPAAATTPG